ncbi:hypothetical protein CTAYLR_007575 [Chrysophaeum taylorii]|uniref:Major facilitator superfamily (MFS) profile domain-containing protein n=1 Tax=Chrysophaeum taylorii TaxID=2483200 RepID=A0AAD7UEZ4_9STRA|nr:hypothetical protein CTAYLR_007575 [Chrysophaeum taylorii]
MPPKTTATIGIAFFSVFVDMLGITIILPTLPYLALRQRATGEQMGYLFATYPGCQMVSIPLIGRLSDKVGRRPVLLASLAGSAIGFLVQGMSRSFDTLLLGRAIAGLFASSIPVAQSTVADLVPVPERPRYFAIQGMTLSVAFMFGPGIGAGLAEFSLRTPMFSAAFLSAFGLLLCLQYFEEPLNRRYNSEAIVPIAVPPDEQDEGASSFPNQVILLRLGWLTSFFSMLGFAAYLFFGGLFLRKRFDWGPLEYGFTSMATSTLSVLVQAIPYPAVVRFCGEHGALVFGCGLMTLGNGMLAAVGGKTTDTTGLPLLAMSLAVLATGVSLTIPSVTAILSRNATPETQGAVLGASQGFQALGRVVGPLVYGAIFDINAALPFLVAAASSLLTVVLANLSLLISRRCRKSEIAAAAAAAEAAENIAEPDDVLPPHKIVEALRRENAELRALLASANLPVPPPPKTPTRYQPAGGEKKKKKTTSSSSSGDS